MANGSQKKWVSDIIGDDYKKWNSELVVLDCGTASGKTYFSIKILGGYAQKMNRHILYLCNRTELRHQISNQVNKLKLHNTICVTSYQTLQSKLQKGEVYGYYDYIIADECHYFITDARFNDSTDIAYNYIMSQKESVVLLVSATAKIFFCSLLASGIVAQKHYYKLDKDYAYVDKMYYYHKGELEGIINDILANETDSKILVFCNSGNTILSMNDIYGDKADYYCSQSAKNKHLKSICGWQFNQNGKVIKEPQYIKKYSDDLITFKKRLLFTTSVLDNGIDLKDRKIKHIISEFVDVDTMMQAFGRKRSLGNGDNCCLYVRLYEKKGIQGFINATIRQLEPVKLYRRNYKEFYNEYGNGKKKIIINRNDIFYVWFDKEKNKSKIKVNECKFRKYKQDEEMYKKMKEMGHKEYLESILEKELIEKSEEMVCNVEQIDTFIRFLQSIEGRRLYANDQQYIKEEFRIIGVELRYKGINTFNGALEDIYKDIYRCRFYNTSVEGKSYIDKRRKLENGMDNPNRDKRYWVLEDRSGTN